ncbi:protein PRRC2A-like [Triticum dicoccoides]|uniref:protein PRRC2A-like n=1 Tax=Triticum dicoccoides TaxID=85692 RepID=UPI00188E1C34|nr:protein PRRC2A-like [Triticum dicoccoides]
MLLAPPPTAATAPASPTLAGLGLPQLIDGASGRVLPCIALREAVVGPPEGWVDLVSGRILPCVDLSAMAEEAASRVSAPPSLSFPGQVHTTQSELPELLRRSWADVANSARPRLNSIIVDPAVVDASPAPGTAARQAREGSPASGHQICTPPVPPDPATASREWTRVLSRRERSLARRQIDCPRQRPKDSAGSHHERPASAAAEAFKRRFGNCCYRCLAPGINSSSAATLESATPASERAISSAPKEGPAAPPPSAPVPPQGPMEEEYIPGAAHRRPMTSISSVVSTPAMEAESYRLRTTALLLTATGPCDAISGDMVVRAIERDTWPLVLPWFGLTARLVGREWQEDANSIPCF